MQKATYYMIPFTGNVQNRQIYRDKKYISGYQGLEGGEGLIRGSEVSSWGDKNVLKLDCDDDCTNPVNTLKKV